MLNGTVRTDTRLQSGHYEMGALSFGKHERIKKRRDFLRTYEEGVRVNSRNFIVILSRNETENKRLGITVTRKAGNAVKRNRIKRLLREFFRLNKETLPGSHDLVVIVKKGVPFLTYDDVYEELTNLFTERVINIKE